MRLVIDGHRLTASRTGVGRCLESLLADWAVTGYPLTETLLVVRDGGGLARVPVAEGLRCEVVGRDWPGLVWETFGLGRRLRRGDLLFAPANLVPLAWRGPTVAVIYDTLPWSVPASFPWHVRLRFGWRYRSAARRASRVVVPSRSTARDVVRVHGIDAAHVDVVYPGPEPFFRPLPRDAGEVRGARGALGLGDDPFFLFVGKRSGRRNVAAVLAAFQAHRARHPGHRLVFVGPDGADGLPGRGEGVVAAGHVSEGILHGLLASALALLYPSDYEGFGLPVVEAQACGCPVVTLANSALVESAGDAAYFLGAPSGSEIATALDRLATDGLLRASLAAKGLANAAKFPRGSFADGVKAVIRRVAAGVPCPSPFTPQPDVQTAGSGSRSLRTADET